MISCAVSCSLLALVLDLCIRFYQLIAGHDPGAMPIFIQELHALDIFFQEPACKITYESSSPQVGTPTDIKIANKFGRS